MAKAISDKLYTITGTSRDPKTNIRTYRFATGKLNVRVNMLKHKKHGAIKLMECKPMTKVQCMAWLMDEHNINAVLPTRAANKKKKSPILIAAIQLAEKKDKIRTTKAAKKKAAATPAAATEAVPA